MIPLTEELRDLLDDGTIEENSDGSYSIPALSHRIMTATGWTRAIYRMGVEQQDDGLWFDVIGQDESLGEQTILSSDDADEVAAWIIERVNDAKD